MSDTNGHERAAKAYEQITGRTAVPAPPADVWVLVWSHPQHGDSQTGWVTAEDAYNHRAELVRDNWDLVSGLRGAPQTPDGLTDCAAAAIYFEITGESGEVYPLTVGPRGSAKAERS